MAEERQMRVTYHYCYVDRDVAVVAKDRDDAIWQAFRQAELLDWYTFKRLVVSVKPATGGSSVVA